MIGEARVLAQLLRGQARDGTHAEKLQAFYAPQAEAYDRFREGLLHGRAQLIEQLDAPHGARVVELGAGTGRNLLFFGERRQFLGDVYLVDLCPAMLEQSRRRSAVWPNVQVVEADATCWRPPEPVDCVYFSYSLTMMPDWRAAIDNAIEMLRPGGQLGVVDFYVSQADKQLGRVHHGAATRWFWRRWFGHDGVRLDPNHLDYLIERFADHEYAENAGPVPYLPFLRVPHYRFIGRKSFRWPAITNEPIAA